MEENASFIPEIYIGENGNWFINGYDTGVPATGPKGDRGDKGETGPAGPVNIANNLETTEEGYALDARQGKILNDNLNSLPVIDCGKITATTTKAAVKNITIPFTKKFPKAPVFTFSQYTSQLSSDHYAIKSVDTKGAVVSVYSVADAHSAIIYWQAILL